MRKLWLRALVSALATCLPGGVFAGCGHSGGVDFCGPELIGLLYVTNSGVLYVRPTTRLSTPPPGFACTPVSGAYFVLSPNLANFQQIYAALLAARTSGVPMTLVADPAQATCTILYVTL